MVVINIAAKYVNHNITTHHYLNQWRRGLFTYICVTIHLNTELLQEQKGQYIVEKTM